MGSAEILSASDEVAAKDASRGPTLTRLNARVVDTEGNAKELLLNLRANHGAWRLVVPDAAIEKYAALLQVPAEPAGSTGNTPR